MQQSSPKTMTAAVWHGSKDLRVEQVPVPDLVAPDDVIVEVTLACICASDVAEYRDGPHVIPTARPHRLTGVSAPVTLGHEFVGRVAAVGPAVTRLAVGDRVCGDACIKCGECYWCLRGEYNICELGASIGLHLDGAFAKYLRVPSYTLHVVPDAVSDRAAALVEPLAVGFHALQRGRFTAGDTVVVMGFGMVGAAATMMALAAGAAQVLVVEGAPDRIEAAKRIGAAAAFAPGDDVRRQVRSMTGGRGADVVVDCTGRAEVIAAAAELSRRGGRVVICGIAHEKAQISPDRIVYFEREIIGSLGYRNDHEAVIQLLAAGRIDVDWLFAPAIALEDIVQQGFEVMLADRASAGLRIPVRIGDL